MILINLLPYRQARRRQQILNHLYVFLGAILLVTLACGGIHVYGMKQLAALEAEYADLHQKNMLLVKKIGQIRKMEKLRAELQQRLDLVDQLQKNRFRAMVMLITVSKAIPRNVWITDLVDEGGETKIVGFGESNKAVADFIRALETSPIFEDVHLDVIERVNVEGFPMRRFRVRMHHLGGEDRRGHL